MPVKKNLNAYVNASVVREFRGLAEIYEGKVGDCLAAAMLLFLRADPKTQKDFLHRVFDMELSDQTDEVLKQIREQQCYEVAERDVREKARKGPKN